MIKYTVSFNLVIGDRVIVDLNQCASAFSPHVASEQTSAWVAGLDRVIDPSLFEDPVSSPESVENDMLKMAVASAGMEFTSVGDGGFALIHKAQPGRPSEDALRKMVPEDPAKPAVRPPLGKPKALRKARTTAKNSRPPAAKAKPPVAKKKTR